MLAKILANWSGIVARASTEQTVIFPKPSIFIKGNVYNLKMLDSKVIYKLLIQDIISLPKGLIRWCEELELSDKQINCAFSFAADCTPNIFRRVFQYKINTNILPTSLYLFRYKVLDSDTCGKCQVETGTIIHSLWECEKVYPLIDAFLSLIKRECHINFKIEMIDYLFGIDIINEFSLGLNHCLLELKIFTFYNSGEGDDIKNLLPSFIKILGRLMVKEKNLAIQMNKYDEFACKWHSFSGLYDFRGPDIDFI